MPVKVTLNGKEDELLQPETEWKISQLLVTIKVVVDPNFYVYCN
jgi:hypothetical protein